MSDKTDEAGGVTAPPSWQDDFKLRADLVQRDIYAFEENVHKLGGFNRDGSNILASHALKAAIKAGWLEAPASEVLQTTGGEDRYFVAGVDVDEMHPGKVRWYGLRIVSHYSAAVQPPPN